MSNRRKIRRPVATVPNTSVPTRIDLKAVDQATCVTMSQEIEAEIRRQVERDHPGLPPIRWAADPEDDGTWSVEGVFITDDPDFRYTEDQIRDMVTKYAKALNGSGPHESEEINDVGRFREIATKTVVAGLPVSIWGVLEDPGGSTLPSPTA